MRQYTLSLSAQQSHYHELHSFIPPSVLPSVDTVTSTSEGMRESTRRERLPSLRQLDLLKLPSWDTPLCGSVTVFNDFNVLSR